MKAVQRDSGRDVRADQDQQRDPERVEQPMTAIVAGKRMRPCGNRKVLMISHFADQAAVCGRIVP